jgi:hypothetical protein
MRLDELFKNLGYFAGDFAAQLRDAGIRGVPLEELDFTVPGPSKVALTGPARVTVKVGDVFRVEAEGEGRDQLRFTLGEERLAISGGDEATSVTVTSPAPRKLAVAGSGRMTAERLGRDGKVSIAGSGRLELADVEGGRVKISIAGSGRLVADGRADALDLSIAGSGSCDAEGLVVDQAAVHIAGSGDAIFSCDGEVSAHLMGSGNVIVRGSARCSVNSVGSGTLVCERARERTD